MALVTTDDVVARLGRPATDATEAARIQAFIEDASALVVDFCWTDFQRHENESFEVQVEGGKALLALALFPGLSISSVALDDGPELEPGAWYVRRRTLYIPCAPQWSTATVTASWGHDEVPASVKAAICVEVIRWLSVSPGTVTEKTGDLEVQYTYAAAAPGLSEAVKNMIRKYRPRLASIPLMRS
ncbi:hypothetical protein [Streptomyces sp. NPDC047990]|uniref:hypothetical protein n=1 Tax=Streptomyces sp. NPDC047990 TaxID=3365496 RepID=UPI0037146C20